VFVNWSIRAPALAKFHKIIYQIDISLQHRDLKWFVTLQELQCQRTECARRAQKVPNIARHTYGQPHVYVYRLLTWHTYGTYFLWTATRTSPILTWHAYGTY